MLEEFLSGQLYIEIAESDLYKLKILRHLVGNITYVDGSYIDERVTRNATRVHNRIGVCYYNKRLMFSTGIYRNKKYVSLDNFIESINTIDVEENEIENLFM